VFGEVNGKQGKSNVISGIHEVASLKQSSSILQVQHATCLGIKSSADEMDAREAEER